VAAAGGDNPEVAERVSDRDIDCDVFEHGHGDRLRGGYDGDGGDRVERGGDSCEWVRLI
jgi:hypothetical protein